MKSLLAPLHRAAFRMRYRLRMGSCSPADNRPRPEQPHILVSGFVNEAFGIGRAAALTAQGLESLGYQVSIHDLRPGQRGLLTRPPRPLPVQPDIWLIHANPPEARMALVAHDSGQDVYRIGYWAWESDLAPADWAEVARWFHEIWTPSRFVRDALARTFAANGLDGMTPRLRVVPHPVPVPDAPIRPRNPKLRVLTLFDPNSGFERKNPQGSLKAWMLAFPAPSEGAELIVKSHDAASALPEWKALQALAGGRPDIVFIAKTLGEAEQRALIGGSDILLSLHRAEGYGLPLAEAMAAGAAVIATEGTGNADFMTAENSVLIPAASVPASRVYNGPQAHWLEPDMAAAADALRTLGANPDLRHALGSRAYADARRARMTWTV